MMMRICVHVPPRRKKKLKFQNQNQNQKVKKVNKLVLYILRHVPLVSHNDRTRRTKTKDDDGHMFRVLVYYCIRRVSLTVCKCKVN